MSLSDNYMDWHDCTAPSTYTAGKHTRTIACNTYIFLAGFKVVAFGNRTLYYILTIDCSICRLNFVTKHPLTLNVFKVCPAQVRYRVWREPDNHVTFVPETGSFYMASRGHKTSSSISSTSWTVDSTPSESTFTSSTSSWCFVLSHYPPFSCCVFADCRPRSCVPATATECQQEERLEFCKGTFKELRDLRFTMDPQGVPQVYGTARTGMWGEKARWRLRQGVLLFCSFTRMDSRRR